MKLELLNGRYLDENFTFKNFQRITIEDGHYKCFDQDDGSDARSINCEGKLVLPALTDLNTSFAHAGLGGIESEIKAAASGGFSTICCAPDFSTATDNPATVKLIDRKARGFNSVQVLPIGAMTQDLDGVNLAEYAELKEAGCIAFSNAYNAIQNLATTKRCFEYASTYSLGVHMHPMVKSLYEGCMHSGALSTTMGLQGISPLAESIAVAQLCLLASETGVHLHLSQISSEDSVQLIRDAKSKGVNVTADVAIANLVYSVERVRGFNSTFHVMPPLRDERDRIALIAGLKEGTIDAVCSAHRPCSSPAKLAPFAESEHGMSTIEHIFNYGLLLEERGDLELSVLCKAMTSGAAKVLELEPNCIKQGAAANFIVLDPAFEHTVTEQMMHSKGKNSPLLDTQIRGQVEYNCLKGEQLYPCSN